MTEGNALVPWSVQKHIRALGEKDEAARARAFLGLAKAAANEKTREAAVAALIGLAEGADRLKRNGAVDALWHSAKEADISEAVPALAKAFLNSGSKARMHCLYALERAASRGSDISEAVLMLIRANASPSEEWDVKEQIGAVLGQALLNGKSRDAALEVLFKALGDRNRGVRDSASAFVGNAASHGIDISRAFPELIKIIEGAEKKGRANAAKALGEAAGMGADISEAVPALIGALGCRDRIVWFKSGDALSKAGLNEKSRDLAIGALTAALGDSDQLRRENAAWVLDKAGPRDYGDLKRIAALGRKMKGEGENPAHIAQLYSSWSGALDKRTEKLVLDKNFPLPKVPEPGGFGRVGKGALPTKG